MAHEPVAVVVHAVEAVPLGVELREAVSDLGNLSRGRIANGVRLSLVDPCDPLTNTLQILFDILEKDKEDSAAP